MDFQEYWRECKEDPEYRKVAENLEPILDLADEVFNLRMAREWTQEELAERVGTKQANISRIENGLANPTFETLQKLSEAFGTNLHVTLDFQPQQIEKHATNVWLPGGKIVGSYQSTVAIEKPKKPACGKVAYSQ